MQKELPVRKKIRLEGYDYSKNGAYFITICVKDKHEMLGRIVGAGSARPYCELSDNGKIVENAIITLCDKYADITIDKYVIMSNHVHFVVVIGGRADPAPTVAQIIGHFKYQTTKEIDISGFWQRSYHDHIIRNESDYQRIWQYIDENPAKWAEDRYFV